MDDRTESSTNSSNDENEEPDPRIQIELERLNHAAESINHLEAQLDEARKTFEDLQTNSQIELLQLEKKIGSAVGKVQAYYEARVKLVEAKEILMKAKHRFERAQALHVAAKEIALTSVDYIDDGHGSTDELATWNETYRHAMVQAADAEREKFHADIDQQKAQSSFDELDRIVKKFEKDLRRSINKSKPFYQLKADLNKEQNFQKMKICELEKCVQEAKGQYQQSLKNLEQISNEIHERRGTISSIRAPPQIAEHKAPIAESPEKARLETLSAGVFTTPSDDRLTPSAQQDEDDDHFNDQFILRAKMPNAPIILSKDKRSESYSSQQSDDEDEKSESLHALPDEQIAHLIRRSKNDDSSNQQCQEKFSPDFFYSLNKHFSKVVLED